MSKGFEFRGDPRDAETVNRWMDKMEELFLGLRLDLNNKFTELQDEIDALTPTPTPVVYSPIIGGDGGTFVGADGGGMVGVEIT